jgi:hypothetical protein
MYTKMIGYNINNEYQTFWSSDNYKEFFTEVYDFRTSKTSTKHSLTLQDRENFANLAKISLLVDCCKKK